MKSILLLLSALIVVPAWAEDAALVPVPQAAPQAAPATAAGSVVIELKGATKSIAALVADLEKEAVYQEAACAPAKKSGKTTKITCVKASSGLMTFLSKYAVAKVRWSISGATTAAATAAPVAATVQSTLACATGCTLMNCPPPGGPVVCCKRTINGYKPC